MQLQLCTLRSRMTLAVSGERDRSRPAVRAARAAPCPIHWHCPGGTRTRGPAGGKRARGGSRSPGDARALPGGNFGGRSRGPALPGGPSPMAQRILSLAAEEGPERLQEALQSLAEGEVRGARGPGGEAPPGLLRGRLTASPCLAAGGHGDQAGPEGQGDGGFAERDLQRWVMCVQHRQVSLWVRAVTGEHRSHKCVWGDSKLG